MFLLDNEDDVER